QLPQGVQPQISPMTPTGELVRYTLSSPWDLLGHSIYSLHDLKSLQDWTLQRQFRRIPRIADVVNFGGAVKRYEIHPDPERLKRYGITLTQLQNAIANSNANVGGDYLFQGPNVFNVRGVGLMGGGRDPMQASEVLSLADPDPRVNALRASEFLRAEEQHRLTEIRQVIVASVNNVPIRVEDLVEGGPLRYVGEPSTQGVVVGSQTRQGRVSVSRPRLVDGHEVRDDQNNIVWDDDIDKVQGIVLMRKGEETLPALHAVKATIDELNNTPGALLPGVTVDLHF